SRRGTHLEQTVEQVEGPVFAPVGEADPGRVGARAILQPEGGPQADAPGDAGPHAKPLGRSVQGSASEIRPGPDQADIAPPAGPPAVATGAAPPRGVGKQALPVGVPGAVVPAPEKGTDHAIHTARAVAEPLTADHGRQLDDAHTLVGRAMR